MIPSGLLVVEGTGGPERLIGAEEGAEPSCKISRTSFEVILREEWEREKRKRKRRRREGSRIEIGCSQVIGCLVL